jgi:hypothetical protein
MHDARLMRGVECFGNLSRDRQRLTERDRSFGDSIGQAPLTSSITIARVPLATSRQ